MNVVDRKAKHELGNGKHARINALLINDLIRLFKIVYTFILGQ